MSFFLFYRNIQYIIYEYEHINMNKHLHCAYWMK